MPLSLRADGPGISTPGATRSTQLPKLARLLKLSLMAVGPTVMAAGTPAGPVLQASAVQQVWSSYRLIVQSRQIV